MRINGSLLLVVAMMVGSLGAIGCKSHDSSNDAADNGAATEEDNPATAPVSTEAAPAAPAAGSDNSGAAAGTEKDAVVIRTWATRPPPAVRVEERGVAPGAGYFWRPGYYGWAGHDYRWYGGHWYPHRVGYEYVNPGWHHVNGRWGYRPGRWVRR